MDVLPHTESLEDLFNALFHNSSSGGSRRRCASTSFVASRLTGISADEPLDPAERFSDSIESAVSLIISELSLKQMGQHMPEGPIKKELIARVDASIAEFLDDYCAGTHVGPSNSAGAPPWVLPTVTWLTTIGSTMRDGELRNAILGVAAIMVQKSFARTARSADLKDLIAPEERGIV